MMTRPKSTRAFSCLIALGLTLGALAGGAPAASATSEHSIPSARAAALEREELLSRLPGQLGARARAQLTHRVSAVPTGGPGFKKTKTGYSATDATHVLTATFTSAGMTMVTATAHANWQLSLVATTYGRGKQTSLKAVRPVLAASGRLEYRYPNVTVWFKNPAGGLEQGITLAKAPKGSTNLPVTFNLKVGGALKPKLSASGQFVQFLRSGKPVLAYAGLGAWDAGKKRLPAHLAVNGSTLTVSVNDAGAAYPMTVDPYFSAQELINSDAGPADWFGSSVAMTPDGRIAVVGSLEHGNLGPDPSSGLFGPGAAYVFTRSGSTYLQTAELSPQDGAVNDQFGESVAVSNDGNDILVSANGHNKGTGAVYAFTFNGTE